MKKLLVRTGLLVVALVGALVEGVGSRTASACDRYPVYRYSYRVVQPKVIVEAVFPPKQFLPVIPPKVTVEAVIPAPIERYEVPSGATLTLTANFLSKDAGYVTLHVGDAVLQAEVLHWEPTGVQFRLPSMGVRRAQEARLEILSAAGQVNRSVDILLVQPRSLVVHDEGVSLKIERTGDAIPGRDDSGLILK